ncbi:MAG: thioredoxin domain-containing protein [Chloroflexota bacterium]
MHSLYRNSFLIISLLYVLLALGSCQEPDKKLAAEVDGTKITTEDLDRASGRPLFQLYQQIYTLQRQKLDDLIDERLLGEEARRQNISVDALLEQEVKAKVPPVTEDDILALYNANKARIPVELDKVRNKIRDLLQEQKLKTQRNFYIQSLRAKAKITTYLKPPPIQRANVVIKDAPSRGAETAPVKIVKFEDFECPFCRAVQPTLAALLKKYDGKIRIIHKDLPLEEIHPQAQLAAEAARCAEDQGKFWQYHDTLYHNAPKLSPADLKAYAKEVGLDVGSFDQCLASGKHKAGVQQDLNEGAKLGLTGTPSFFINGREISGAQPLEAFSAIIDEELAQAK